MVQIGTVVSEKIQFKFLYVLTLGQGQEIALTFNTHISSYIQLDVCIHVISLKRKSGRFSSHFREVFKKCIEYIGKLLIHFREISKFCKKLYVLEEILGLISGSLPDDQGGFTCMCLLLLTFRSLAAIVSEIYTVFSFSYRKA